MNLGFHLKLEQSQKLIMTPELRLAITLLQYSNLELQDHIQEELLNNPVLEILEEREEEMVESTGPAEEIAAEPVGGDDFPWEEYFRDLDLDMAVGTHGSYNPASSSLSPLENYAGGTETMLEDLLGQLRMLSLSPRQFRVAAFLAGNLDANGYLQGELGELAGVIGVDADELEEALNIVQRLEPAGVGCRNLRECLLLQLKRFDNPPVLAMEIVKRFLPATADGRYHYITSSLGCAPQDVQEAVSFIRTLNPKPGSVFGEGVDTRYIVPDVIVEKVNQTYVVTANDSSIPQLMISSFYQNMLKNSSTDEQLTAFIKQKIEKAYWLVRSIEQRRTTMLKVSQQIVDIQKPFLDFGIKWLKPLNLKDVALMIGVHESTVSRATANKYIQTPRGLLPLKFFFCSGLVGTGGTDYSSPSVKNIISELVGSEEPLKPLSDQQLTELLQERGINIARRTVAKYREEMLIPVSYKRRRSQG
ncbi:MAG TPA: RNA polymerase factor sigma-54 [Candidatus Limnocylindrales bacterium]|nr:RNA polymerase factor sigma-54 [Candidatus Limnocylindrales bacterium]